MAVIAKVETEYVSVQGAETMTGRSRWSWRRDAYEGRIASVKLGAKLLIPISEIRRLVAENTRPRIVDKAANSYGAGVRPMRENTRL